MLQPTTKIGIAFVSSAILVYGIWMFWILTLRVNPINIPITLSVGHIRTQDFTINVAQRYEIDIEVQKKIPFDELNCLMGMSLEPQKCGNIASVVDARWTLSSDGKVVAQGEPTNNQGGGWAADTISREIGYFDGKSRKKYRLDIEILKDGRILDPGNPRLRVGATSDFFEGLMFTNVFLIWPISGGLVVTGIVFLLISLFRRRRRRVQARQTPKFG